MNDNTALRGLDHVVIALHDLDRGIADYRALGFTVVPGGSHPGRSSHNALVVFADGAYLELIAWRAPAPEERWWRVLQAQGEGLVDFALLPVDTAAATDAARARGLHSIIGPLEGGRVRPDGATLQWRTARQASADLPFLCGDVTPRSLRVPEGELRLHANGALGVAALHIAVRDLTTSVARYRALLGPATPVELLPADAANGPAQAVFVLGATRFSLVAPAAGAPAAGAPLGLTDSRDEGVKQLTLAGAAGAARHRLSSSASHGVAIAIG